MSAIVGIDPGGRDTGIVAINSRDEVLTHRVLHRETDDVIPDAGYVRQVLHETIGVANWLLLDTDEVLVAVEGVTAPNPQLRRRDGNSLTNPAGIIGAAMVLGGLVGYWTKAIVIPPGRNGSHVLDGYPLELRPTRGKGRGQDRLRHARSAFDVARAARYVAHTTRTSR